MNPKGANKMTADTSRASYLSHINSEYCANLTKEIQKVIKRKQDEGLYGATSDEVRIDLENRNINHDYKTVDSDCSTLKRQGVLAWADKDDMPLLRKTRRGKDAHVYYIADERGKLKNKTEISFASIGGEILRNTIKQISSNEPVIISEDVTNRLQTTFDEAKKNFGEEIAKSILKDGLHK